MRELRDGIAQFLALRQRYLEAKWDKEQVLWASMEEADCGARYRER